MKKGPDFKIYIESELTSGGPSWASVFDGFNLAFECPNSNCPSHKDKYYNWVHIGGKGDYIYSKILFDKFTCTACNKETPKHVSGKIVKGFCFRNCNYRIAGSNYGK